MMISINIFCLAILTKDLGYFLLIKNYILLTQLLFLYLDLLYS